MNRRKLLKVLVTAFLAATRTIAGLPADAAGGYLFGVLPSSGDRIIADRVGPANTLVASLTQAMIRCQHTAQANIVDLQLMLVNSYTRTWNGAGPDPDTGPGAAATVTASIEYPAGTFTQIKSSGSPTLSIADGGRLLTDKINISIPNQTQFWVRLYWLCSAGIVVVNSEFRAPLGDACITGTSGVVDQTMSGTITSNDQRLIVPMAIIGTSNRPAVAIIGTSIAAGVGDTQNGDGRMRHGYARSFTTTAFVNLAQGGATCASWIADHPNLIAVLPYCTSLLTDMGENDYFAFNLAGCIAQMQTIYALMLPRPVFQCTMLMRIVSSSDGFLTVASQIGHEHNAVTQQLALNAAIVAGIPNVTGYCDTWAALSSTSPSNYWRCDNPGGFGAPPITADGTHPDTAGQDIVWMLNAIDQTRFH